MIKSRMNVNLTSAVKSVFSHQIFVSPPFLDARVLPPDRDCDAGSGMGTASCRSKWQTTFVETSAMQVTTQDPDIAVTLSKKQGSIPTEDAKSLVRLIQKFVENDDRFELIRNFLQIQTVGNAAAASH